MALRMRSSASKTASITPTMSTTLVKNLFRAAYSSIAFIRNFFDDDCFQVGKIGATKYHKIVDAKKEDVRAFVDWFEKGVFDALQNKYLEVVMLQVFARDPKAKKGKGGTAQRELLECFSFHIKYNEDGSAKLSLSGSGGATSLPNDSKEAVKKNTSEVLRSLVEMTSSLKPLPKHRILCLKLLYTPETPKNYEPPLFTKAKETEDMCWFTEKPIRAHSGTLKTPYHQLSMSIRLKSTVENRAGDVLRVNDSMDVDDDEDMMVDVGGSQGNSVRVALPRRPLRESQPVVEASVSNPLKMRLRQGADSVVGRVGSQVTRGGMKRGRAEGTVTEGKRKRLNSTVKKVLEQ